MYTMKKHDRYKAVEKMTFIEARELLIKTRGYAPDGDKNQAEAEKEFMSVFFYLCDIIN